MQHNNAYLIPEQHRHSKPEPPSVLRELVEMAGVHFNGSAPWDIQVHHKDAYRQILTRGTVGLGESYMDGLWDCVRLDETFTRFLRVELDEKLVGWMKARMIGEILRYRVFNLQSPQRAFQVGEQHYDTGNDIFEAMLDPTMTYSCAYWPEASSLEQAQRNKLDLICRKLELCKGERLLDIGCGWGGLAKYAAEHYGVNVTGVTVSREQQQLAQERCAGLPVQIELMDYRSLQGTFDKIVSVGMFEHVGTKNYRTYFDTTSRLLKDDGLFLLHSIGTYKTTPAVDPWINKYIFPNGKLPSAEELASVLDDCFLIEDWHNFGPDYDKTLMAWWQRFDAAWPALADRYDERFYRMWRYYLLSCAGFFRSRQGQLWQLVLAKRTRRSHYRSVR